MQYVHVLTVTPFDTLSHPAVLAISIPSGVIKRVQIWFRSGTDNLIRCILADGPEQILPTNADGYYALDADRSDAPLNYDIEQGNHNLKLYAWNIGSDWHHDITIAIDVKGKDEFMIEDLQKAMIELMGRFIDLMRSMF